MLLHTTCTGPRKHLWQIKLYVIVEKQRKMGRKRFKSKEVKKREQEGNKSKGNEKAIILHKNNIKHKHESEGITKVGTLKE